MAESKVHENQDFIRWWEEAQQERKTRRERTEAYPVARRYQIDGAFNRLVNLLETFLAQGQYTPTELREAVLLAATHLELHYPLGREFHSGPPRSYPMTPEETPDPAVAGPTEEPPEGNPQPELPPVDQFYRDLQDLLNRHSMENGSDTPDFILASFLWAVLRAWDEHVSWREQWYGRLREAL